MRSLIKRLSLVCLIIYAFSISAYAQTVDTAGFTVRAVLPENQTDNGNTYFDLRMTPGKSQDLQVEVRNAADKPIVLDVSTRAASTNRNGIIEYLVEHEPDEVMRHPFNDISTVAQREVSLGANEQTTVTIRVNMPEEQFDGTILGGIIFTKRLEEAEAQGTGINNRFSYVIGVRMTETDKTVLPDFDLKSVQETLINYRTAVVANIRNMKPVIVTGAKVSAQVYKENAASPLFSVDRPAVDFAPSSVFPLPVEWEGQRLEAGNYRMAVQLNHEGETWSWDHSFSISQSQANEINEGAIPKAPDMFPGMSFWVILILLFILLLLAAFYIGRKSKRSHSREEGPDNLV